nr:hypothetical protein [Streptomyces sp. SID12501]
MFDLGVSTDHSKAALGRLSEKAGRLKPNGRLFSRSPLSDVLELESMLLGVQGKTSCWRPLTAFSLPRAGRASGAGTPTAGDDSDLDAVDVGVEDPGPCGRPGHRVGLPGTAKGGHRQNTGARPRVLRSDGQAQARRSP